MNAIGRLFSLLGIDKYCDDLARRVDRNVLSHRDPEEFHTEKSEIKETIIKLGKGEFH